MDEYQIPWQELLGTLFRRWRLLVGCLAIATLLGFGLAWSRSPSYEASAKVMVTAQRARLRVAPDGSASSAFEQITEATLNSEAALLRSAALIREVLAVHQTPARAPAPETFADRLVRLVTYPLQLPKQLYRAYHRIPPASRLDGSVLNAAAQLNVAVIGRSNLIQVSFRSGDPQWAARFLNELLARHVARHAQMDQETEALKFFEAQHERIQAKAIEAEAALAEFTAREGIRSVPDLREALKQRLTDAELALAGADTQLAEATARAEFLAGQLRGAAPIGGAGAVALPLTAGSAALIQSRIVELELQRSQLLAQYTPTSIKVREVDRQLAEAHRLLALERDNPLSGPALVANPFDSLELDYKRAQGELAAVRARIDSVSARSAEYREQLKRLEGLTAEYEGLQQEADKANTEARRFGQSIHDIELAGALDDLGIVNVTVVEPAAVPAAPMGSTLMRTVALAAGLGLLLGVGLAVLRDRLDPALKCAAEAERLAHLPVLADIPA